MILSHDITKVMVKSANQFANWKALCNEDARMWTRPNLPLLGKSHEITDVVSEDDAPVRYGIRQLPLVAQTLPGIPNIVARDSVVATLPKLRGHLGSHILIRVGTTRVGH